MKAVYILIVACLVLIATRHYFRSGFPYTHDGENHLARFANYKIALKEGQFPPRIAPNLYNHYGYPVFNYNYPLANILSVPFSVIGLEYETTFKVLVIAFLAIGVLGCYQLFAVLQVRGAASAAIGAGTWISAPYVLELLYVRGSIGEISAFCLVPWLLWSVERLSQVSKKQTRWICIQTFLTWAVFFLSHNSSVLFVTPTVLLIGIFRLLQARGTMSQTKAFAIGFFLALASSLWFWLPALLEQSATVVGTSGNQNEWKDHFVTLPQLLFGPVQFGFSHPGSIDSLGFGIGLSLVIGLILGFARLTSYFLARVNSSSRTRLLRSPLLLYIGVTMLLLYLQTSSAEPIWSALPFVRFIQFPWRLSLLATTTAMIVLTLIAQQLSGKARWLLVMVVTLVSLGHLQLRPVDYFHKQTIDYDLFAQSTSTQNENRAAHFSYTDIADWRPSPSIIDGLATVQVQHWSGSKRAYNLVVSQTATLVEPTMYFPGWRTTAQEDQSGAELQVTYTDSPVIGGRIGYVLEPGSYRVHTVFTQRTPARVVGNSISSAVLIGVGIYMVRALLQMRAVRKHEGY